VCYLRINPVVDHKHVKIDEHERDLLPVRLVPAPVIAGPGRAEVAIGPPCFVGPRPHDNPASVGSFSKPGPIGVQAIIGTMKEEGFCCKVSFSSL
jgi:hypothetical protein